MAEVTVRPLRNQGAEVLDRVLAGERLAVARGRPIAELRPLPVPVPRRPAAKSLVELPAGRPGGARDDLDRVVERARMTATHDRGLLDTSTVILLDRLTDPGVIRRNRRSRRSRSLNSRWDHSSPRRDEEQAARQAHLQQAEADFDPLPFDVAGPAHFGRLAASLRRAGRKPAARAYDAMIAAVAISNDLPLYTCNPQGFAGIDGLTVVPVPHQSADRANLGAAKGFHSTPNSGG